MANFLDLPRPVRDRIYRLHLVRQGDGKMTADEHEKMMQPTRPWYFGDKNILPISRLSPQIEKEADPIYFSENHFEFRTSSGGYDYEAGSIQQFTRGLSTHQVRLVRKVTIDWPSRGASYDFGQLARLTRLEELYVGIDEASIVKDMKNPRYVWRFQTGRQPTPQESLIMFRCPGMSTLLNIKVSRRMQFIKSHLAKGEVGGPIPGGVLETTVAPKLLKSRKQLKVKKSKRKAKDGSAFLELPPELRNRVYALLLHIDGPIHPSKEPPSSIPKNQADQTKGPLSALTILGVNRQIYDEAVGIFYNHNQFEFFYPTQLHMFLQGLSVQRQSHIRDITLHYYNTKVGGVDLVDMTFPMLKQLTGLRRLHIILFDELLRRMRSNWWPRGPSLVKANPMDLGGMGFLFALRGITDIQVRDLQLEREMERIKSDKAYPTFAEKSKEEVTMKLEKVLGHFNAALHDAQVGKINEFLFNDDEWHMKDPLPTMEEEDEEVESDNESMIL